MSDLEFVRKFPDNCCASVSRNGELEPCDKVAVAIAHSYEEWDDWTTWWPVCAYHTRRATAVPLADLLRAMDGDDE